MEDEKQREAHKRVTFPLKIDHGELELSTC
jgi:hypothetical protein